jgi:hypothetical protein
VLICKPMTLGALRALSPDIEWTDDKIKRVAAYRPHGWEDTLPVSMRSDVARIRTEQDGKTSDDTLVFPLKCYLRETADYENGAYLIVVNGRGRALSRPVGRGGGWSGRTKRSLGDVHAPRGPRAVHG